MTEPFAMYRLDDKRRIVRYLVVRNLDPDQVVAALQDFEAYILWKDWFLKDRAKVYAENQLPLAEQAAHDWQQYLSWE